MVSKVLRRIVQFVYDNTIRPYLPKKVAVYNGVPVKKVRLFDQDITTPEYEGALIAGIRKWATKGENVVQVGGGLGVSAVASVRAVEPEGSVIVYEGSQKYLSKVSETLSLNNVEDSVQIQHGVVGSDESDVRLGVGGEEQNAQTNVDRANVVNPEDLPACDVLVLDCEGAEKIILERLEITPRVIIVESHGVFGSPTDLVKEKLRKLDYKIEQEIPEVVEEDVYVITATRRADEI